MDHLRLLVAGGFGGFLEVHLAVAGQDADEMAGPVAVEHERLVNLLYGFAEFLGHVLCGQVFGVELVWHQLVCNAGAVKEPRRIGFLYFR